MDLSHSQWLQRSRVVCSLTYNKSSNLASGDKTLAKMKKYTNSTMTIASAVRKNRKNPKRYRLIKKKNKLKLRHQNLLIFYKESTFSPISSHQRMYKKKRNRSKSMSLNMSLNLLHSMWLSKLRSNLKHESRTSFLIWTCTKNLLLNQKRILVSLSNQRWTT